MAINKKRKTMELSAEERKRRSDLAKKLNREKKFGGRQEGAGRPKKQRASEVVAEGIREDGEKILAALRTALKAPSPSVRLKAALAMLDVERKEFDLQSREEQRMYDNMDRAKMLDLVQERIQLLKEQGIDIGEMVEGRARAVGSTGLEKPVTDPGRLIEAGD